MLLFLAERVLFRAALVVMGLLLLRAIWLVRRRSFEPQAVSGEPSSWPRVTVQLPIRNELHVAERAIRASAELDYPRDLLEIQVIDDSDDETSAIIEDIVRQVSVEGAPVRVFRRAANTGNKAGALAEALMTAEGQFVAIFDADGVPAPDFLRRTLPVLLSDPKIGLVQARWTFINRDRSLLTKLQALLLDGLMLVDQVARSRAGISFQFNGTAGIWRRSAIDTAGGWRPGTLTEDLDLSFRARLTGAKLVHLPTVEVATELTDSMRAYRRQQARWACGNAQALRQIGPSIVRSTRPLGDRLEMLVHICRRFLFVALAILTVSFPLTTFNIVRPPWDFGLAADIALVVWTFLTLGFYFATALRLGGRRVASALLLVPAAMGLQLGLSLVHTVATVRGLLPGCRAFEVTPKTGELPRATGRQYRARFDLLCLLECAIGFTYLGLTGLALSMSLVAHALFMAFVGASYLAVGAATLLETSGQRVRRAKAAPQIVVPAPLPARRIEWLVFAVLFLSAAYFHVPGSWNPNSRMNVTLALVERHTTAIDAYHTNTNDKAFSNGHFYSDKAPGASFVGTVPYSILYAAKRLAPGWFSQFSWPRLRLWFVSHFVSGLALALTGLLLVRVARRLGAMVRASAGIALGYGLGTIAFTYSTMLFGHVLAAAFCFASFALVLFPGGAAVGRHRLLWAGFLAGWAFITEYPTVGISIIIALYAIRVRRDRFDVRALAWFALGAVAPLLLGGAYAAASFGHPFEFGYANLADPTWLGMKKVGVFGLTYPRPSRFLHLLFTPHRGLLIYSPFALMGFLGFLGLLRGKPGPWRTALVLCGWVVAYLLVFDSSFEWWAGGSCFGPRHLMAMLPFLCLAAWPLVEKWPRAALLLGLASTFLAVVGVTVGPIPAESIRHPLFPMIERFFQGRLLTNGGSFLRLRGLSTLLPLLGLWGVAGVLLWRWTLTPRPQREAVASADGPIAPAEAAPELP